MTKRVPIGIGKRRRLEKYLAPGPFPSVMAGRVFIGANLAGRQHGRCIAVMPGAGPTSTPGGIETKERRGWWAPRPSPGTCFAHHDAGATTTAMLAPMGRDPAICASTVGGGWPGLRPTMTMGRGRGSVPLRHGPACRGHRHTHVPRQMARTSRAMTEKVSAAATQRSAIVMVYQ